MSILVVIGFNWFVFCVRCLWIVLFIVLGVDKFVVMGIFVCLLDVGVINF